MFKVGDRVKIVSGAAESRHNGTTGVVVRTKERTVYPIEVRRDVDGETEVFYPGALSLISEAPAATEPTAWEEIRRAAEIICSRFDWGNTTEGADYWRRVCGKLRVTADRLEAAAAPKPEPTLADRLEELWEKRGRQGFELGIVREFAEILRGEDKSPVKALAREFVDGYPTKMWPQGLLVEAFRDALAREEPSE